jgi:SAM-dependent methyltransferase
MDNRQGFAWMYDIHHSAYVEDIPFWIAIAQRQSDLPALELGCGSGRVTIALALAGCPVVGLDIDPEMLLVLQKRLENFPDISLPCVQADMTNFHLEQLFGAILLPCNTLSTFSTIARQNIFNQASTHLKPGGWFAASLPNPDYLRRLPVNAATEVEETFTHPLDHEPVQVSSGWKRAPEAFTVTWHYDHLLPDGRIDRTSIQVKHSLDPVTVYQEQLDAAGLALREMYGDFDFSAFTADSANLILVAQRPT